MAIANYATRDFVRRKIDRALNFIETMYIGYVTSADHENMRYDVQPILKEIDIVNGAMDKAVIVKCPMLATKCGSFYIRAPYEVGDMVYVGVSKEPIDEAIKSSSSRENKVSGIGNFRMVDGVILGGILSDDEERLSDGLTDAMVFVNRLNGDKVVMTKGSGLELYTSLSVKIDSPVTNVTGVLNVEGDINGASNITIEGNMTGNSELLIQKDATVMGGGKVAGALQAGAVSTKKGTTLDDHTHTYSPGGNPPTETGTAN